jgi:peptide/nickel transport system permease protein
MTVTGSGTRAGDRSRALSSTRLWMRRRRRLLLPLALCAAVVLAAVIGPFLAPYQPDSSSSSILVGPSAAHWFGTDQLGRDTFSRMLAGTRVSITIGVGSVLVGLVFGTLIGIVAGLRANTWLESVLMRLMDLLLALPVLVVASVLAGLTGGTGVDVGPVHLSNTVVVLLIIALVVIPIFARLARASTMAEAEQEYVLAARISGLRERRIIFGELLPNVIDPLIVQAALSVAAAIAAEAALSFLGLGIQPPQASWGNILQDGQQQLLLGAWWLILFPTAAIAVSTLAFVLLGDRLRDELDPRNVRRPEAATAAATGGGGVEAGEARPAPAAEVEPRAEPAPAMEDWQASMPLVEIEHLTVRYRKDRASPPAVSDVSFSLQQGEVLGIVGESGSGKSTVLRSVMGILPASASVSGTIRFEGRDLLALGKAGMSAIRGARIGMVFQDPVNVLNPAFTVGGQLERVLRLHRPDIQPSQRRGEVLQMLSRVGIDGRDKLGSYPFEFSQGQLQRIAIAAACLGSKILLLLADEPTTSLDATIESQIMTVLEELRHELDLTSVIVSHDIALISQHCERMVVMYAGRVVEEGTARNVVDHPQHPYTAELLRAVPELGDSSERLYSMRGELRDLAGLTPGCPFAPRCPRWLGPVCDGERPELRLLGSRRVACHAVEASQDLTTPAAAGHEQRPASKGSQR